MRRDFQFRHGMDNQELEAMIGHLYAIEGGARLRLKMEYVGLVMRAWKRRGPAFKARELICYDSLHRWWRSRILNRREAFYVFVVSLVKHFV